MIEEGLLSTKQGGTSRAVDIYIIYKFIKYLTLPFEDWEAYKLGIINDQGKVIKKSRKTKDEKNNYTLFHRLVRNLKVMLEKIPGGKSKLGKAAAAYFLLREELIKMGGKQEQIDEAFSKHLKENLDPSTSLMMESALSADLEEDYGITFEDTVEEDAVTTGGVATIPTPLVTEPDGQAMGMYYYKCSTDVYNKCMRGKRKTGRWQQYLEGDERAEGIKNWAKLNAKTGIMIQDKSTGAYTVLRRPHGTNRWSPHY